MYLIIDQDLMQLISPLKAMCCPDCINLSGQNSLLALDGLLETCSVHLHLFLFFCCFTSDRVVVLLGIVIQTSPIAGSSAKIRIA